MENQYHPQRFRVLADGRCVGTVPTGTIIYLQDGSLANSVCRNPWIVEAWKPREVAAAKLDANGRWQSRFVARGGHLAIVRSLRDGRRTTVADHHIRFAYDNALIKE